MNMQDAFRLVDRLYVQAQNRAFDENIEPCTKNIEGVVTPCITTDGANVFFWYNKNLGHRGWTTSVIKAMSDI